MTLAKDGQNHINSPNWCLARASSPASAVGILLDYKDVARKSCLYFAEGTLGVNTYSFKIKPAKWTSNHT